MVNTRAKQRRPNRVASTLGQFLSTSTHRTLLFQWGLTCKDIVNLASTEQTTRDSLRGTSLNVSDRLMTTKQVLNMHQSWTASQVWLKPALDDPIDLRRLPLTIPNVSIPRAGACDATILYIPTHIRHLEAEGYNNVQALRIPEPLTGHPSCTPVLQSLRLVVGGLGSLLSLDCLQHHPQLESLDLTGFQPEVSMGWECCAPPSLRAVVLRSCTLNWDNNTFQTSPGITDLRLIDCWEVGDFSWAWDMFQLVSMSLHSLPAAIDLTELAEVGTLTHLTVSNCTYLTAIPQMHQLLFLDISYCRLVRRMQAMRALRDLHLKYLHHLADFQFLRQCKNLTTLSLFGLRGLVAVSPVWGALRTLRLSSCRNLTEVELAPTVKHWSVENCVNLESLGPPSHVLDSTVTTDEHGCHWKSTPKVTPRDSLLPCHSL
jgi:hypothetical protein